MNNEHREFNEHHDEAFVQSATLHIECIVFVEIIIILITLYMYSVYCKKEINMKKKNQDKTWKRL